MSILTYIVAFLIIIYIIKFWRPAQNNWDDDEL